MTSRQRRKAERRWRRTGLAADLQAFKDLRNQSNTLLNVARKVFYKDLIDDSSGERKKLFSVTNRLLGVERDTQYPPFKDKVVLNKIISLVIFFAQKIVVIQNKLDNMATTVSPGSEKCLADSLVVQPMDSLRVLMSRKSKSSLKPRLRNPARLTQCLRLLLSAALIFCCLLSSRSLISLFYGLIC